MRGCVDAIIPDRKGKGNGAVKGKHKSGLIKAGRRGVKPISLNVLSARTTS